MINNRQDGNNRYQISQIKFSSLIHFWTSCRLALKVATIGSNAPLSPEPDAPDHLGKQQGVQGCHLPPDVGFKLVNGGWPGAVHFRLEKSPKEGITEIEVW